MLWRSLMFSGMAFFGLNIALFCGKTLDLSAF
jgi:hypothetical protein